MGGSISELCEWSVVQTSPRIYAWLHRIWASGEHCWGHKQTGARGKIGQGYRWRWCRAVKQPWTATFQRLGRTGHRTKPTEGERVRKRRWKASSKMYENEWCTAHPFSHGHPHWWAVWQWPWLGVNCESEKDHNDIPWSLLWNSQRNKGEISTINTACFLQKKERSLTRNFIRKVKSLHYATVKEDQSRGITVALTKIFSQGFEHIKVTYKNFFFIKCNLIIVYSFNWFTFLKMLFLHS